MRIAAATRLTALTLLFGILSGVLACGSDAADDTQPGVAGAGPGMAGAAPLAGAGGSATAGAAGAALGGSANVAGSGGAVAGASAGGSAGSAASAAGAAGASAGAGGNSGAAGGSSAGAGGSSGSAGSAGTGGAGAFALTSPEFMNKPSCAPAKPTACDQFPVSALLPSLYSGKNLSPELDWTAGPAGTLSYALVLYDESNMFAHWVIWNIPAATRKLPGSLPGGSDPAGLSGAKQTSFYGSKDAYAGPGAKAHVYQFKLYALKVASLNMSATVGQMAARAALESSPDVLAKTELVAASPP